MGPARRFLAASGAALALSALAGLPAGASAPAHDRGSGGPVVPQIGSKVDPCLLGTWTSLSTTIPFPFGKSVVELTGAAGITVTLDPDGLEIDNFDAMTPLVGTSGGTSVSADIRGIGEEWDSTSDGTLRESAPIENTVETEATVGGVSSGWQPVTGVTGGSLPYSCSASRLTFGPPGAPGTLVFTRTSGAVVGIASTPDGKGYWTASSTGVVRNFGDAAAYAGVSGVDDVVAIAPDPVTQGVWLVGANGSVYDFGGAAFHGSLPALGIKVSDIVAIAPTSDGKGYWLVGADGGEFAFGDAGYHGSLPGLGIHVDDIEGMVATPSGSGYLMVGADGGVFAFGAVYHGSLPGLGIHVDDIVGILPTAGEAGYVLVGADGGAFVFGTGAGYHGSLPGEGIKVTDVTGIALAPGGGGYWMVRTGGEVYPFGNVTTYG